MKKAYTVAFLVLVILQSLLLLPGCGGQDRKTKEDEIVNYAIESILIPQEQDNSFVVESRRKSTGVGDVSPDELAQRFWKWEGGSLAEISPEEYQELAAVREGGDPTKWTYSEHAITVIELDEKKDEAVVEIGSLYGPITGSGTQYLVRKEGGEWKKISEVTVWTS